MKTFVLAQKQQQAKHGKFRPSLIQLGWVHRQRRRHGGHLHGRVVEELGEAVVFQGEKDLGEVYPDPLQVVEDVLVGAVTGKSRRGVDHLIAANGWEGWFSTTQTADDAPSKPDPAMLVQAMAETGIGPSSTVMVGDTSYDMAMAVAAGAAAIGVAWGYHPAGALFGAGAVTVVETAAALGDLFRDATAA